MIEHPSLDATSTPGPRTDMPSGTLRVPLTTHVTTRGAANATMRHGEPVTFGVPFARGVCRDTDRFALVQDGQRSTAQTRTLDRWADGSVRWLLVDGRLTGPATTVELERAPAAADGESRLRVDAGPDSVVVATGSIEAIVDGRHDFPLARLFGRDGRAVLVPDAARLSIVDEHGVRWPVRWTAPRVDVDGPLKTVVSCRGAATRGRRRIDLEAAFTFHAGLGSVGFRLMVRNPAPAGHPGGKWDLGDPNSVRLREVAVALRMPDRVTETAVRTAPDAPWIASEQPVSLFQASSGGERWDSSNHLNRDHRVALDFKGFEARTAGTTWRGGRATPLVEARTASSAWTVGARYFWEVFPKAVAIEGDDVLVSLFPKQCADPHDLQPGEQTTWDFVVAFERDGVTATPLDWVLAPSSVQPSPAYTASTGAIPHLTAETGDDDTYRRLVRQAIEGPDAFSAKRETIDEFGWRHFGDVYGDHEAVFHRGPAPLVSHWNNQYDAVYGALCQLLRSGDRRWLTLGLEAAAHVVDIDIYHTVHDKNVYNGGLFWHTCHYVDADTATHRTYPCAGKVNGGGPSCGHLYSTGLVHAYFLTGDPRFRDAALGLADYVINCDDGGQTRFRWIDAGPTGHATGSGSDTYHGPGRAPANALNALVDGHRLSGDERYLTKAFEIVHRCIHPADDLAERNLLDAENKWFYTMFLQSVGKLLDYLEERGRVDAEFFYARESLLHYTRWMAAHERPFLEHPEQLEYPTETWAAQDMRKCEVFQWAARYANEPDRARFFERATFFFEYSTRTLWGFETRALCRPTVLMMTNGWSRPWFVENLSKLPAVTPVASATFGEPRRFVAQKQRVLARLKLLAAVAATVVLASAAAGAALLIRGL